MTQASPCLPDTRSSFRTRPIRRRISPRRWPFPLLRVSNKSPPPRFLYHVSYQMSTVRQTRPPMPDAAQRTLTSRDGERGRHKQIRLSHRNASVNPLSRPRPGLYKQDKRLSYSRRIKKRLSLIAPVLSCCYGYKPSSAEISGFLSVSGQFSLSLILQVPVSI